jgi:hypothetical protein
VLIKASGDWEKLGGVRLGKEAKRALDHRTYQMDNERRGESSGLVETIVSVDCSNLETFPSGQIEIDKLTGELLCPPPDVADGEFVENPRLTLGAILKAL